MNRYPYSRACNKNKRKNCANGSLNVRDTTGQSCQGNECNYGYNGIKGITGSGFDPSVFTYKPDQIYIPNGYGGMAATRDYYKNLDTKTVCALNKLPTGQSNFECYDPYNKCPDKVDLSNRRPIYYQKQFHPV